jgi:protein-disulfide isomerase
MIYEPGNDLRDPVVPTDHIRGDSHARVSIVEYGDFECPMCRSVEPAVRQLLGSHPLTVRLVFRHHPLESAHPHALIAAEAAEAAAYQGKFWEMHDLLLQEGAKLERAALDGYAANLGLDLPLFKASLDDEIYRQRVREHIQGAIRSQVRSSPAFFVNGRVQDVSAGAHVLREAVMHFLRDTRALTQ